MTTNDYANWFSYMEAEDVKFDAGVDGPDLRRLANLAWVASEQGWRAMDYTVESGLCSVTFRRGRQFLIGPSEPDRQQALASALLLLEPHLVQTPAPK